MNPALSPDALYAKSQVYIRRGLRAQQAGDTEEYQLWASLALELLGKAVLAKTHPALVADPNHYQSLFMACGRPLSPDVKTITAKTLFDRLGFLDKSFDARHISFCEQLSIRRNAELHSGESPFSGMQPEQWEREYWGAVFAILGLQGDSLEGWLGAKDAKGPSEIVAKAAAARVWEVEHRIKRAGDDFVAKHKNPTVRAKVLSNAESFRYWDDQRLFLNYDEGERHVCPACGAKGVLLGSVGHEEVIRTEFSGASHAETEEEYHRYGEWRETVEKLYYVEEYYCPACHLDLFGTDEIAAAKLPETFSRIEDRERDFGEDYMNE